MKKSILFFLLLIFSGISFGQNFESILTNSEFNTLKSIIKKTIVEENTKQKILNSKIGSNHTKTYIYVFKLKKPSGFSNINGTDSYQLRWEKLYNKYVKTCKKKRLRVLSKDKFIQNATLEVLQKLFIEKNNNAIVQSVNGTAFNSVYISYFIDKSNMEEYTKIISENTIYDNKISFINKINDNLPYNSSSNFYISNKEGGIYSKETLEKVKDIPNDMKFLTNFKNGIALTNKGLVDINLSLIVKKEYEITNMDNTQIKELVVIIVDKISQFSNKPSKVKLLHLEKNYSYDYYDYESKINSKREAKEIDPKSLKFRIPVVKNYVIDIIVKDNNISSTETKENEYLDSWDKTIYRGYGYLGSYGYYRYKYSHKLNNTEKINQFITAFNNQNIILEKNNKQIMKIEEINYAGQKINKGYYENKAAQSEEEYQKELCKKCKVDFDRTTSPKKEKNIFGLTESNPGKIVMENYQEYEFYYEDGKFTLKDDFFGLSNTEFDTYEEMIKHFIEACANQYCK